MENNLFKGLKSFAISPSLEIGSYEALWDQNENMGFAKLAKMFSNGQKLLSGNKCSRPLEKKVDKKLPNLYEFKQNYLYQFKSFKGERPLTIGLPLVLNFYDALPFWFTFFKELGFSVEVSDKSTRDMYKTGQHTIPSDTVCYGAKLVHGHIFNLIVAHTHDSAFPMIFFNLVHEFSY